MAQRVKHDALIARLKIDLAGLRRPSADKRCCGRVLEHENEAALGFAVLAIDPVDV
jgi:hypothetical protein